MREHVFDVLNIDEHTIPVGGIGTIELREIIFQKIVRVNVEHGADLLLDRGHGVSDCARRGVKGERLRE